MKQQTANNLLEWLLDEVDDDCLMVDGFDEAIIGYEYISGRIIYNVDAMIDILMNEDGMVYLDALEYLEYNVFNAYVGEKTPIYVNIKDA